MSDNQEADERPCLHCLIGDLIDEFYAEYGSPDGEPDTVDVSEIMTALAKTVAEFTYASDVASRQRVIEELTREILQFDAEYREQSANDVSGLHVRH
jgi:hypothetical protein